MRHDANFRLACQAAIAMMVALSIQSTYNFERSYWSIFACMALFSTTLGSSIKKSLERIAMTIVGGSLATLIYYIIPAENAFLITILLCSVFFQICFLQRFYLGSAFFSAVFVVFFFALMQSWTFHLLVIRVLETILGAAITIFCSFCILPIKTEDNLLTKISLFIKQADSLAQNSLAALMSTNHNNKEKSAGTLLLKQANNCLLLLAELDQEYVHFGYEINRHHSKEEIKNAVMALSHFYHYLSSMVAWLIQLHDNSLFLDFHQEFDELIQIIITDLTQLHHRLTTTTTIYQHNRFITHYELLEKKISLLSSQPQYTRQSWLDFFTFCYFLKNMHLSLQSDRS